MIISLSMPVGWICFEPVFSNYVLSTISQVSEDTLFFLSEAQIYRVYTVCHCTVVSTGDKKEDF